MTDRERALRAALEEAYGQIVNLVALLGLASEEVPPRVDTVRLQSALSGIQNLARFELDRIEAALS